MGCNVEAFRATYLKGIAVPSERAQGWAIAAVVDDPIRPAIDVVLEDAAGRQVIAYVERRVEGARSLVATRFLSLSYYVVDAGLDDRLAADVVRGVGALLRTRELALKPADVDAVFAATSSAGVPIGSWLELRINRDCNEACLFCNTPPDSYAILAGRPQVLAELDRQYALGYRRVTFTGRETTLDPHLEEYVRAARARGYAAVRVQTNGTTFSNAAYLARLVAAGLSHVQISLHTLDRDTFARLVGRAHLLDKTLAGLRHVLATPRLACEVLCVVTTLNVGELERFVAALVRDFATPALELVFSPVAPVGWGEQRLDLLPRLADLRPAIARALALCAAGGVAAWIPHRCGLPLCAMPPEFYARNMDYYVAPGPAIEASKAKPAKCRGCVFDGRCVGVWKHYLATHGDGDIEPVRTLPAA